MTACAVSAAWFSTRASLSTRRRTSMRCASVTSSCLPITVRVIGTRTERTSVEHLALVRRRDLQLLAVLGNRAARQREALLLEDVHDLRVAERPARVFGLDDLPDALLDRDRRHVLAVGAADAAVEEIFH